MWLPVETYHIHQGPIWRSTRAFSVFFPVCEKKHRVAVCVITQININALSSVQIPRSVDLAWLFYFKIYISCSHLLLCVPLWARVWLSPVYYYFVYKARLLDIELEGNNDNKTAKWWMASLKFNVFQANDRILLLVIILWPLHLFGFGASSSYWIIIGKTITLFYNS